LKVSEVLGFGIWDLELLVAFLGREFFVFFPSGLQLEEITGPRAMRRFFAFEHERGRLLWMLRDCL
jgi:hypothetical protein